MCVERPSTVHLFNISQGTNEMKLMLTHLKVGTYVFILKVTDSNSQSSEAKVKVVVLPEKNRPPVAVAGDDKVYTLLLVC